MVSREFILGKLKPYQGFKKLVIKTQDTNDIINEMILAHKLHKKDYDNISSFFWKGNLKDTCQFIFDFLKKNVIYSIEPDARQSVKSPASILATGYYKNGFNDCKHYSQFFSGILDSLKRKGKKLDWWYRFANYQIFNEDPHHVFVVARDNKGEYWCDAVLKTFNERKPYINKIDKKMSLYSISGTRENLQSVAGGAGLDSIAGGIGRKKHSGGKKKGVFKKIHEKFRHANMLVAMAPSRAAFILLVKLNAFKMVNKFAHALTDPARKQKLLNLWYNIGGNKKFFEKLILNQYAHWKKRKHIKGVGFAHIPLSERRRRWFAWHSKRFPAMPLIERQRAWRNFEIRYKRLHKNLHPSPHHFFPHRKETVSGIGAVQLVAILAAAVPVITALAAFMPKGAKEQAVDAAGQVTPAVAAEAAAAAAATSNSVTTIPPQYQNATGPDLSNPMDQLKDTGTGSETDNLTDTGGGLSSMSMPVKIGLGVGAAVALYFITKKK